MENDNNKNNEGKMSRLTPKQKKRALVILGILLITVVFIFLLFKFASIKGALGYVMSAVMPIIYGIAIAYLMNPVANSFRNTFERAFKKMKNEKRAKSLSKTLSIILAALIFLAVVVVVIWLVIPQLYDSISKLVKNMPGYLKSAEEWYNSLELSQDSWANTLHKYISKGIEALNEWISNDLMKTLEKAGTYIITGTIDLFGVLFNIFIGFIVSIYALFEKDSIVGQSKKLLYATFKTKRANRVLDVARHADKIFGGFLTGKLLASIIFAILSIIILSILKVPYALLVSIVVAIFNLIPVFGPIIGAIPCAFIVLLADPWKCLVFLIVDVVLQLIDGNIITPRLLGNTTGLSPFWVMFALLFFGGIFGFPGMLLGVPTFAVIYYIVNDAVRRRAGKKGLPVGSPDYEIVGSIDPETKEITPVKKEEEASVTGSLKFVQKIKEKRKNKKED